MSKCPQMPAAFAGTVQMVGMGAGKPRVVELTFRTQEGAVAFADWLFGAIQDHAAIRAEAGEPGDQK